MKMNPMTSIIDKSRRFPKQPSGNAHYNTGYNEDGLDSRDYKTKIDRKYKLLGSSYDLMPKTYSNKEFFKDRILSQGNESSCAAHGASQAVTIKLYKQFSINYELSERWAMQCQYFDGWDDTSPETGDGTTYRAVLKFLRKYGCVEDDVIEYSSGDRVVAWSFPEHIARILVEAPKCKVESFSSCMEYGYDYNIKRNETIKAIKQGIIRNGSVMVGMKIPKNYYNPGKTGIIIKEMEQAGKLHDAHGFLFVGWKIIEGKMYWEFLNSWGRWWGDNGFGYWPLDWFLDDLTPKLSSAFTINSMRYMR